MEQKYKNKQIIQKNNTYKSINYTKEYIMQNHYIYLKLKLKLNKSNKQKFLKNTLNTKCLKNKY